jgi:hypothetical protein
VGWGPSLGVYLLIYKFNFKIEKNIIYKNKTKQNKTKKKSPRLSKEKNWEGIESDG